MHDMIEGNYPPEATGRAIGGAKDIYRDDVTLRQNIDQKIKRLQFEIEELEQSKIQLAPMLDMRLDLMRKAMSDEYRRGMMRAAEIASALSKERSAAAKKERYGEVRVSLNLRATGMSEVALAILTELETETEAQS